MEIVAYFFSISESNILRKTFMKIHADMMAVIIKIDISECSVQFCQLTFTIVGGKEWLEGWSYDPIPVGLQPKII